MLTPTDIHLIVGLLCKATNPEEVEVTLGDFIYDEAAQKKRDVDVTISYKNEKGENVALLGIEVKDHSRPIDVIVEEQLCIKFKDMPSIERGGIVSASGYTQSAINKAKFYEIDLFELKDWKEQLPNIPKVLDEKNIEISPAINGQPKFNYLLQVSEADQIEFNNNTEIFYEGDNVNMNIKTLDELSTFLLNQLIRDQTFQNQMIQYAYQSYELMPFKNTIVIENCPYFISGGKKIVINEVDIEGFININRKSLKTELRTLLKNGTDVPLFALVICEKEDNTLLGMTISIENTSSTLFLIPLPERLKTKIANLKLS